MITRYAIFEGRIKDGKTEEFRAAVLPLYFEGRIHHHLTEAHDYEL